MSAIYPAFAAVVRARPDRPAIAWRGRTLSYAELDAWARRTAACLPGPPAPKAEETVGVCAGNGPAGVAATLGVLASGRAYLPIDPSLPDARIRHLTEDSGVRCVVSDAGHASRVRALAPSGTEVVLCPEPPDAAEPGPRSARTATPPGTPPVDGDGSRLAYVLYTSGSTGTPKGVMVEQRSVVALARNPFFGVTEDDVFLRLAPVHADPSVFETFAPLLNGALLAFPAEDRPSVHGIGADVRRNGVTVLRLVAPLFRLVVESCLDDLSGLRLLISGGDRASPPAVARAARGLPGCRVVNGYGPTEATVYACCHVVPDGADGRPTPIGGPIPGVTARILDADGHPAEQGEQSEQGELCLGGAGLARGYLNRPDLTAERFVTDPASGARLYRTGDLVRRGADGLLEFLGRLDDQLKVRGFRVEPGEVEAALTVHPAVGAALVRLNAGRLEALVTPDTGVSAPDLRAHLARLLPDHMVPALIRTVDVLPTLPNGKPDRTPVDSAPPPSDAREATESPAPGSATGKALAAIWSDVLGAVPDPGQGLFELGGDSLAAMDIAARIVRDLGVRLAPADVVEARTLAGLIERVGLAREEEAAIPTGNDHAPLTPGQQGIWIDDQAADVSRYTISRTFRLRGAVDADALRRALDAVVERHGALRSAITRHDGELVQRVGAGRRPALRYIDLSDRPPGERDGAASGIARASAAEPIDLAAGPVLRLLLIRTGREAWTLHLDVHHIVADDWSLDVLLRELSAAYAAARTGEPAEPTAPAVQFADYAAWTARGSGEAEPAATAAWSRRLAGYPGLIDLPTDHPRPRVLSGRGGRVRRVLGRRAAERVARLAREHDVSRYMVAMSAVYLLLARYSGQEDVCVGTPVAGRDVPGTEGTIGYFANLLAARISPDAEATVPELLAHVREVCLELYAHQRVPLHAAGAGAGAVAGTGAGTLFQVVVAYQQRPPHPLLLPGADVAAEPFDSGTAKFELGFGFEERDGELHIEIEYSTDVHDEPTVSGMARHLANVFEWLAAHPSAGLRELDMTDEEERRLVLGTWNDTALDVPADRCLHELFAERARTRPDKVAVRDEREALTYAWVDGLSDGLAGALVRRGVRPGRPVAVCLPRSARLTVAMLAVMKAGAVYVPLDPSYPPERLSVIMADAGAEALVTSGDLHEALFAGHRVPDTVVDVAEATAAHDAGAHDAGAHGAGAAELPPTSPGDLAYIIYTSGSTGRPRGVAIEHRSAVNMLVGHRTLCAFEENDVWSQFAASGFDMAIYEQLQPLLLGATSVVCPEECRLDGRLFVDFVNGHGVTVMVTSPAFLRSLGRPELPTVRHLLIGGEAADLGDVRHYAPRRLVLNGYGPTETTICATSYVATGREDGARLPVGGPLPNTRIFVLDEERRLAPVGVPGEIYIGGAGLARGYWNDDALTRERFVRVPGLGAGRLYRSGDRGRWLPDGTIDVLGRLDQQAKIRGFRVEPGEIESVLARHPDVRQAAVVPHAGRLVAFVAGTATEHALRGHLASALPAYMVPARFVGLDALPMTEHAKIDRRALARAAADADPGPAGPDAGPLPAGPGAGLTGPEREVARVFGEVLNVRVASGADDFFELGGHSLLIVQVLARLESEFGARLSVREFLAEPNVKAVAARVAGGRPAGDVPLDPAVTQIPPEWTFPEPVPKAAGPEAVLLTGATGFLGPFLLAELLRRTDAEVYCLVRAGSEDAARERLRQAAARFGVPIAPDDPRIVPVPGDLAAPGLGVAPRWRARLAERADTIVHAGAQVHHLSPYRRLAPANVDSTRALIELATDGAGKRLHHISSLSVFDGSKADAITEASPARDEVHAQGRGYAASKWAADVMVQRAMEQGAHAGVHRLGRISGDSRTGAASLDDMFYRLLATCDAVGSHPDAPALRTNLLPVDVAAAAVVALALDGTDGGPIHHLHHPDGTGLEEFMAVRARLYGGTAEPVPLERWLDLVDASGRVLPIEPYRPALREMAREGTAHRPPPALDNSATLRRLDALGVAIPAIDAELIGRYWHHIRKGGEGP